MFDNHIPSPFVQFDSVSWVSLQVFQNSNRVIAGINPGLLLFLVQLNAHLAMLSPLVDVP